MSAGEDTKAGPWEVREYGGSFAIFDSQGKRIAYLYGAFEDMSPEETEATAMLIAAAPDLLNAAQAMARLEEDGAPATEVYRIMANLKLAIKKATKGIR